MAADMQSSIHTSTGVRTGWPRFEDPSGPARHVSPRAAAMAEIMREILFRDGNVTEQALVAEGFTAGEIVEYADEARRHARLTITVHGEGFDRLPAITAKAIDAVSYVMPVTAGVKDTAMAGVAWRAYCTAIAAYRLDPWVSQSERCLHLLQTFLAHLPLLARERNGVVASVAATLRKRSAA